MDEYMFILEREPSSEYKKLQQELIDNIGNNDRWYRLKNQLREMFVEENALREGRSARCRNFSYDIHLYWSKLVMTNWDMSRFPKMDHVDVFEAGFRNTLMVIQPYGYEDADYPNKEIHFPFRDGLYVVVPTPQWEYYMPGQAKMYVIKRVSLASHWWRMSRREWSRCVNMMEDAGIIPFNPMSVALPTKTVSK